MRLTPRTLSADDTLEKEIETPEVLRRYEITVEREFVSVRGGEFLALCPFCNLEVSMLHPERAAEVAGVEVRQIFRWVETKQIHFIEPGNGRVFLCSRSLQELLRAKHISEGDPQ